MKSKVHKIKAFCQTLLLLSVLLMLALPVAVAELSFDDDPDAIERAADSVLMLEVYDARNRCIATGSGFVAINDRTLITNHHVIEGGSRLKALTDDGNEFTVSRLCIQSSAKDIAILQFDSSTGIEPLTLKTTDDLKRAESVVAIGSPIGIRNTVSIGNISCLYTDKNEKWIQFTAPISPGSSGGALLDAHGQVIGMTTATYTEGQNINLAVHAAEIVALYRKWDGRTLTALNGKTVAASSGNAVPDLGSLFGSLFGSSGSQEPITVFPSTESPAENIVYVTKSGKRYHSKSNCSGMKAYASMTLEEAVSRGYTPCQKCH